MINTKAPVISGGGPDPAQEMPEKESGRPDEGSGKGTAGCPQPIKQDRTPGYGIPYPALQHRCPAGRAPVDEEQPAPPVGRKTICGYYRERK